LKAINLYTMTSTLRSRGQKWNLLLREVSSDQLEFQISVLKTLRKPGKSQKSSQCVIKLNCIHFYNKQKLLNSAKSIICRFMPFITQIIA
ncbi:aldo-keto reductase family protein, partial [Pseudoloma neurophilia]